MLGGREYIQNTERKGPEAMAVAVRDGEEPWMPREKVALSEEASGLGSACQLTILSSPSTWAALRCSDPCAPWISTPEHR